MISFEKIIGCKIYNPKYYLKALTHRSFLEVNENVDSSNERLEYLGDAVIDIVVGKYLFNKFPKAPVEKFALFYFSICINYKL